MAKRKILGKEAFLQAGSNLKRELVNLPELGGSVYVREPSGLQLLQYNEKIEELQKESPELTPSNSLELMSYLVSLVVCDEYGRLLFTQDEAKSLMENSISVLTKLTAKALELSGLGKVANEVTDSLKNAKKDSSMEGLQKN